MVKGGVTMQPISQVLRGIIMMCLASLSFTLNDTISKFLIDDYHISVIIFIRSVVALPMLVIIAAVIGRTRIRWSRRMWLHAARGGLNLTAAYLYITGLRYLSLAEATVILFSSPLVVIAASSIFFKEQVGWQKWAAACCSFCGVLVAIRPGAETFQAASLFILASSFLYAMNSLTARWLPHEDHLWTVSFYGAVFSALFVAPVAIPNWNHVDSSDLLLFGGAALCSSLGIGLNSLAYRLAPASDLAPFAYSGLVWSMAVTWLVWGTIPEIWTFLGAGVIFSSSFFYFVSSKKKREQKV